MATLRGAQKNMVLMSGVLLAVVALFLFLGGLLAGLFVFGEAYSSIAGLVNANAMGQVTIPEAFHMSYGVVVFLVVLVALGGFWGAEKVERWMARRTAEETI